MFNFFKNIFTQKKEEPIIYENDDKSYIHNGMHYFAIENMVIDDIINILDIKKTQETNCNKAFEYLWEDRNENKEIFKIIISENIENWNFIYCESGDYEYNKIIVEKLISFSNKRVNYYYTDSCVDGYDWILANRGQIFREFEYTMSNISTNNGKYLSVEEEKFIQNIDKDDEFIFGENVYISIVNATCDVKTKWYEENQKFTIGEIKK